MCQNNKLSVFLIKQGYDNFTDILKTTDYRENVDGIGTFFYANSNINTPQWLGSFFNNELNDELFLKTSSARGVLICKVPNGDSTVLFAIAFGMGRHMLNKDVIEERFGLKVTLNTIDASNIRSIEKNNIAVLSRLSKDQMSRDSEVSEFGIDIEQDLIRAVTGKAKLEAFGNIISGADSLSVSVKRDISNIKPFLELCYQQYQSDDYKADFGWVDQIEVVKSAQLIVVLDEQLLTLINERVLEKIWMAVPEIIDWSDLKGFKYLPRQKFEELSEDISLGSFAEAREPFENIGQVKSKKVYAYSASTENEIEHWSAYKCIYGEITLSGNIYVLNNAKWYLVNNDFVAAVDSFYQNINLSEIDLPDYNSGTEGEYNLMVADRTDNMISMDAKNISYGGGHSKIEFCDLLTRDKKIVHVKKYGGSSVLSHLFNQGVVSGELFISDREFRKKLNTKLPQGWKLQNSANKPKSADYEVVYAIISNTNQDRPHIPFFSKVSIKTAIRRLESFGYAVTLKNIKINAN